MLNENNYFDVNNKHLSKSKIKDWLKDKNYFFKKHVTGEIAKEVTDPMIIGSAVDMWVSKGRQEFERTHICVSRRNLKNPPMGYTEINHTQYDEIVRMCESLEKQDAYQEIKDSQKQVILTMDMDLGQYFTGISGVLDFLIIKDDSASIIDLKTAANGRDEKKYHWACVDLGYYMQMAMYDILVRHNYPQVKNISYGHIVVDKDSDNIGVYNVYTYNLSSDTVNKEKEKLEGIFCDIKAELGFNPQNATWDNAKTIGEFIVC